MENNIWKFLENEKYYWKISRKWKII
jgi:hypothetical protein